MTLAEKLKIEFRAFVNKHYANPTPNDYLVIENAFLIAGATSLLDLHPEIMDRPEIQAFLESIHGAPTLANPGPV